LERVSLYWLTFYVDNISKAYYNIHSDSLASNGFCYLSVSNKKAKNEMIRKNEMTFF
jgi:hypothetical protein